MGPHVIDDNGDESIANIICFGAFADKNSGIIYHNLTKLIPQLEGEFTVCCCKCCNELHLECLDGLFGRISSMVMRLNHLQLAVISSENFFDVFSRLNFGLNLFAVKSSKYFL